MLALLKEKSKVGIASKQRKRFDALQPAPKLKSGQLDFTASIGDARQRDAVTHMLQKNPASQTRNQMNSTMK